MSNINLEKILSMLEAECIRVRDSGDIEQLEFAYLEIQRFLKTEYAKLEKTREDFYLEALNGAEEAEINGYSVSYKSITRHALDSTKLKEYFEKQGISEQEMKDYIYSFSITKPSLKFKSLK